MKVENQILLKKLWLYSILVELVSIAIVGGIFFVLYFQNQQFFFDKPLYLLGYIVVLPLFLIYYKHSSWSMQARDLLPRKYASTSDNTNRNIFLQWFFLRCTLVFLIIALAQPFYGLKKEQGRSPSQDIVFAIDLSNSMNTEDIATKTSRLEVAKRVINEVLLNLRGEKVGLTIFAGDAYLHLALTKDYEAVRLFVADLNTEIMDNQGTNIAGALYVSSQLFPAFSERQKRILVISDGEDHLGGVEDALAEVEDMGIAVSFSAIGTEEGGKIPADQSMPDDFYKKDINGEVIVSKPNLEMIKNLAGLAKEEAFWFSTAFPNTSGLSKALMSKNQRFSLENYENKKDWYQLFTFLSLLFLLFYCFDYYKITFQSKRSFSIVLKRIKNLFSPKKSIQNAVKAESVYVLLLVTFLTTNVYGQTDKTYLEHIKKAKILYRNGQYPESAKELNIAISLNPEKTKKYQGEFAQALYRNGQFEPASKLFDEQAKSAKNKSTQEKANYNKGNALMNQKKYAEAMDAYKEAMRKNPKNGKAKYNYTRARQKLKKEEEQKPPPKKDDKPKEDQKDKKDSNDKKDDPKKDKDEKNNPKDEKPAQAKQEKKLSDQQYKQLLDRINRQERETRKKMNANAKSSNPAKNEKDW